MSPRRKSWPNQKVALGSWHCHSWPCALQLYYVLCGPLGKPRLEAWCLFGAAWCFACTAVFAVLLDFRFAAVLVPTRQCPAVFATAYSTLRRTTCDSVLRTQDSASLLALCCSRPAGCWGRRGRCRRSVHWLDLERPKRSFKRRISSHLISLPAARVQAQVHCYGRDIRLVCERADNFSVKQPLYLVGSPNQSKGVKLSQRNFSSGRVLAVMTLTHVTIDSVLVFELALICCWPPISMKAHRD